ncbi:MAG: hypothetical protein ACLTFZ_01710 [Lachnospiraceae bacterium]
MGITFVFCTFAWSLFRAESVAQAFGVEQTVSMKDGGYTLNHDQFNNIVEMKMLYRIGLTVINVCRDFAFDSYIYSCNRMLYNV